ncbi:MAG: hypothetical protein OEY19_02305 [Gammaproteobacteria bacterium]|nr:hypothetical protein [Gammaproteobacteria bacterium]MDH5629433.1 hypothetical protein [Gammaproteobacteria bacterium]
MNYFKAFSILIFLLLSACSSKSGKTFNDVMGHVFSEIAAERLLHVEDFKLENDRTSCTSLRLSCSASDYSEWETADGELSCRCVKQEDHK